MRKQDIGALEQGTIPLNAHSTCVEEPPHSLPACVLECSDALQGSCVCVCVCA